MPTVGVLALQGDFEAHARVLGRAGRRRPARCGPRQDLDGLEALVIPGGESTTMTLGIEREGLAEPLRELVPRRHAGARHLRGADRARPRPPRAAGRARASATRSGRQVEELRGRPRRAGARRPDYGECSSGRHGSRSTATGVEVLAEVDGHPVAVRQEHPRGGVPPRDTMATRACTSGCSPGRARGTEGQGERPARRGSRTDPRAVLDEGRRRATSA